MSLQTPIDRPPTDKEMAEICRDAAKLIRFNYASKKLARSSTGKSVSPFSDYATNWCSVGAIQKAAHDKGFTERRAALAGDNADCKSYSFFDEGLIMFNDGLRGFWKGDRAAKRLNELAAKYEAA